jgi:hypothetical protein
MDAVGGVALLVVAAAVYFLPTIVAGTRGHKSDGAIFALNLLAGWTALGWLAALVWSLAGENTARAARRRTAQHTAKARARAERSPTSSALDSPRCSRRSRPDWGRRMARLAGRTGARREGAG